MIGRTPAAIRSGTRPAPALLRAGVGLAALARTPGGGGGGLAVPLIGRGLLARPVVSDLVGDLSTLVEHFAANDYRAFDADALPADAATVDVLRPLSGTVGGAVQYPGYNLPTFAADIDGAGRKGVRFTAANSQLLSVPYPVGAGNSFRISACPVSVAIVFRPAASVGSAMRLFTISRSSWTDNYRLQIAMTLGTGGITWRARNAGSGTQDATLAGTVTAETIIAIGQHGGSSYNNRLSVRRGGATSVANASANDTLDWSVSNYPDRWHIGGGKNATGDVVGDFYDGSICELAVWRSLLSDTEAANQIAVWQAKWGVA